MKKKLLWLVLGIGACVVLVVLSMGWCATHHVVKAEDGVIVLNKRFLTFQDTFIDIRGWTAGEFRAHDQLRRALVAQGYGDLVREARVRDLHARLRAWYDQTEDVATEGARLLEQLVDETRELGVAIEGKVREWLGREPADGVPVI